MLFNTFNSGSWSDIKTNLTCSWLSFRLCAKRRCGSLGFLVTGWHWRGIPALAHAHTGGWRLFSHTCPAAGTTNTGTLTLLGFAFSHFVQEPGTSLKLTLRPSILAWLEPPIRSHSRVFGHSSVNDAQNSSLANLFILCLCTSDSAIASFVHLCR